MLYNKEQIVSKPMSGENRVGLLGKQNGITISAGKTGMSGSRGPILVLVIGAAVALVSLFLGLRPAAGAATLPVGFAETPVASGLSAPTTMALAPDGRLFVAEQAGKLRVIKAGQLLAEPFVDLTGVVDPAGESGLLGVAFDPGFPENRFVYLYYTRKATEDEPVHNRIVRFTANGDTAVAGSEKTILRLNPLSAATNHNGGALHFGRDGKLYAAVGENANPNNSQTLSNLLGKMLRINRDGTIPRSNPYFGSKRVKGKNRVIWALGLRNPYTFAFRPGTATMFINDVGAGTYEEINRGVEKANYGWPYYEGPDPRPGAPEPPANLDLRGPIFAYRHDAAGTDGGCAITGGAFYDPREAQFPKRYVGDYFFADFCRGWIRSYDPRTDAASDFATGTSRPVDLDVDRAGNLYYLERGTSAGAGAVYRIKHPGG
jgi:glucose/arabinose dehydrogenase